MNELAEDPKSRLDRIERRQDRCPWKREPSSSPAPSPESLALVEQIVDRIGTEWDDMDGGGIIFQPNALAALIDAHVAELTAAAERQRDEWRKDFNTLCKAIVGETGLSAIQEAGRLRALRAAADAMADAIEYVAEKPPRHSGPSKVLAAAIATYRALSPAGEV